jgi:hypothetical protein
MLSLSVSTRRLHAHYLVLITRPPEDVLGRHLSPPGTSGIRRDEE